MKKKKPKKTKGKIARAAPMLAGNTPDNSRGNFPPFTDEEKAGILFYCAALGIATVLAPIIEKVLEPIGLTIDVEGHREKD